MPTVRHRCDNSEPGSPRHGVVCPDSHLLAALEAERIPRGTAFTWHPAAPELDDDTEQVELRRAELVDALTEPLAAGWNPRAARQLRLVA